MSERLAYLAGLMDGEGSFSIQVIRRKTVVFSPRLTMSLKYGPEALDLLVEEFGGKVYGPGKDHVTRWSLGGRTKTIEATEKLLPYLVVKHEVAEKFLEALALFPKSAKGIDRAHGEKVWSDKDTAQVIELAESMNRKAF